MVKGKVSSVTIADSDDSENVCDDLLESVRGEFKEVNPRQIQIAEKITGSVFWNARQKIDAAEMDHLFTAIRTEGLIEEIVVRDRPDGSLQVVCGERRLRTILRLLEKDIECYDLRVGGVSRSHKVYKTIRAKVLYNCSDKFASKLSVSENVNRKQLSEFDLMEYCRELHQLADENGNELYNRKDIGFILGRSPGWVSQTMSLYDLPQGAIDMLVNETLPRTVALVLLKVNGDKVLRVLELANSLAKEDVSKSAERLQKEVAKLEDKFGDAEIEASAAMAMHATGAQRTALSQKSLLAKKIEEAKKRQLTISRTQPRLNSDIINRATDQVPGARRGKNTGMSQKAIRSTLVEIDEKLSSLEPIVSESGDVLDERDVKLLALGFRMALGKVSERNPFEALQHFCTEEGYPAIPFAVNDAAA